MKIDTTAKGLETLIMGHMTGTDGLATGATGIEISTSEALD